MARILLGVSGGIAAYKVLEFVRLATAAGHSLRVLQTPTSRRFVGTASFAALSGAPVLVSEFERDPARGAFPGQPRPEHEPPSHLELVARAQLYLVAPASANTLAKLAHGLADNLVSSCALAARCPLVLAPSMNNNMYEHPAVQANLSALRERGAIVLEPGTGRLAAVGEHGIGRLPEPAELLAACERLLAPSPHGSAAAPPASANGWAGVRVLITAGGTREPIDSVRFLGNSSSGRMGFALAAAARARGARVTLVEANTALPAPGGVELCSVGTAGEMKEACEQAFPSCDVLLMAAAVADFKPAQRAAGKIAKSGHERLRLDLEPTADVLASLAAHRRDGQVLVGFAADHGERAVQRAREKLQAKALDAIVVNDISRSDIGFDSEHNEVTILTAASAAGGSSARGAAGPAGSREPRVQHIERAPKRAIAEQILDTVEQLRARAQPC
jgi:phosphopantothenoylcysteine decarboxylase/phosphopantothenate--cysteine ligase